MSQPLSCLCIPVGSGANVKSTDGKGGDEWDVLCEGDKHKAGKDSSVRDRGRDTTTSMLKSRVTNLWRLARDLNMLESIAFESDANRNQVLEKHPTTLSSIVTLLSRLSPGAPTGPRFSLQQGISNARTAASSQKGGRGRDKVDVDVVVIEDDEDGQGAAQDQEAVQRQACILAALRVMVNLTNHNEMGCSVFANAEGIQTVVELLESCSKPSGNPALDHDSFDVLTLGLGVLINAVELTPSNRKLLAECHVRAHASVWELLVHIFRSRSGLDPAGRAANAVTASSQRGGGKGKELMNDRGGEGNDGHSTTQSIRLDKLALDDLVISAYTSVLIGCAIRGTACNQELVLAALGPSSFRPCIQVLDYFIVCQTQAEGQAGQAAKENFLQSLETVIQELTALLKK
jgi:hypothetical protein